MLTNITEILESLAGAAIFSTIDLNSGYCQVAMDHSSKAKTAFITPSGLFQFNVMPFRLKNAQATFQRLIETVLRELRGKLCFVYIDDIIVYSSNLSQHFQDLKIVLHRLQEAGLTINLKKSKFCLQEILFLGHVVTTQRIKADPNKIEAIRSYPVPTNLKEVQRFLGLPGWYHRFVPNFSQTAEPINALKKKGKTFHWSDQCQQAFEDTKMAPPSSDAVQVAPLRIVLLFTFLLLLSLFTHITSALITYDKETLLDIGHRYTNLFQDTLSSNPSWPFEILRNMEMNSGHLNNHPRRRIKKRRGKRAGIRNRLRKRAHSPPLPSILLANVLLTFHCWLYILYNRVCDK